MSLKVAIAGSNSFADLSPIVEQVECKLSFWGSRYITGSTYEGTAPIDALASRVIELVNQCKFQFTDQERAHGKSIAGKITQIYDLSDTQVGQCNFITRVMVFFRNLPNVILGLKSIPFRDCSKTRWYWNKAEENFAGNGYRKVFDCYPQDYFKKQLTPLDDLNKFVHPEDTSEREEVYYE
jgi:hypothetical protein